MDNMLVLVLVEVFSSRGLSNTVSRPMVADTRMLEAGRFLLWTTGLWSMHQLAIFTVREF